jgi:hypothetical protein
VCSKSNSIIFCLSLFDPVSLSLSTALHTYFPHPSSSLSQAFIHIFPTSLSLSLSWTSHIALIYRFWKWQPDILDDTVCHNELCLNTYNYSYYFGLNSGSCKFGMKQRRRVASRPKRRISVMRARDILTYYTQNIKNIVPLIELLCKAVPLQTSSDPEGSRKLRFPDSVTTAQVVSLTHRPPLPPGNTPVTHFC